MALDVVLILAGLLVLARGADVFVVNAARLAAALGVTPVVVGALVVGFGTGMPELLVSGSAAARGSLDLAAGNIVGSNLANLTLVLGVGGILARPETVPRILRREAPLSFAAVALFAVFLQDGLNRTEGAVLLIAVAGAVLLMLRVAEETEAAIEEAPAEIAAEDQFVEEVEELLEESDDAGEAGQADQAGQAVQPGPAGPDETAGAETAGAETAGAETAGASARRSMALIALGLAATVGGAQMLVAGAQSIAEDLGLSGGFVGLTLVAIGTSLPELVTAVQSARRGETALLVGNVLGSNLFNSLAVGGSAALIAPGVIDDAGLTVLAATSMVLVAALAWLFLGLGRRLYRWEATVLLGIYLVTLPLSG